MKRTKESQNEPVEEIGSFFLDSGAHSLFTKEVLNHTKGENSKYKGFAYYKSPEFWQYVDAYAEFVKANLHAIDFYVNVDVIFSPKLSWKVLKYLEGEHGLNPLPVIHHGTPIKWIDKHLEAGYKFIGIGGLGQEVTKREYYEWADGVFDFLCPKPDRLPIVKCHGFAMTAYELLVRYPWWSVDSASWAKAGGFGIIFVPFYRKGKFTFEVKPMNLAVSTDSSFLKKGSGKHLKSMSGEAQKIISKWLEHIGVPLGSVDKHGKEKEWGVVSHHAARKIANLRYFEALCAWLPKWPWPFRSSLIKRQGFEGFGQKKNSLSEDESLRIKMGTSSVAQWKRNILRQSLEIKAAREAEKPSK